MTTYRSSNVEELSYEDNISMGLMLENEPSPHGDPLDILCQLEEYLQDTHGMTFMQALRAGVLKKN